MRTTLLALVIGTIALAAGACSDGGGGDQPAAAARVALGGCRPLPSGMVGTYQKHLSLEEVVSYGIGINRVGTWRLVLRRCSFTIVKDGQVRHTGSYTVMPSRRKIMV